MTQRRLHKLRRPLSLRMRCQEPVEDLAELTREIRAVSGAVYGPQLDGAVSASGVAVDRCLRAGEVTHEIERLAGGRRSRAAVIDLRPAVGGRTGAGKWREADGAAAVRHDPIVVAVNL